MTRQQAGKTSKLADLIEEIQRGRRSGVLIVRRGIDTPLEEEGTIVFVKGSMVEAYIGPYEKKDAFNRLSKWGLCSFTFTSSNPRDLPIAFSISLSLPQAKPLLSSQQALSGPDPMPSTRSVNPPSAGQSVAPSKKEPLSGPSPTAVPVHVESVETALQHIRRLGYGRPYQHLCLLIDGRHSIADLSRLLSRRPADVLQMLTELVQAGCIQWSE